MLSQYKRQNIIDLLDEKVKEEEDLYVESKPNMIPYLFYHIKPFLFLFSFILLIDFFYFLLRMSLPITIRTIVDTLLICCNIFVLVLLFLRLIKAYSYAINSCYIITDRGIHMTCGGRVVDYVFISYEDIKSICFHKYKFKTRGDIYIKDVSYKTPTKLYKKFISTLPGLIAIDDAEPVYNVLQQIAIQENDKIFFSDESNTFKEVDYLQNIKKYSKRVHVNKNDSLFERRK